MKVRIAFVAAAALAFWQCPPNTDPAAVLLLSSTTASFNGVAGGIDPAPATIAVANGGGGSIDGLTASVTYAAGQPSGWLTVTLSATSAPASLTVRSTGSALAPGSYTATVAVTSARTGPDPVHVQVSLILAPGGVTTVPFNSVGFAAVEGAASPEPQVLAITNTGAGPLRQLTTAVNYPAGAASGWLSATLSATSAPAELTIRASSAVAPGAHTATVTIASPYASNGTQSIVVRFDVTAAIADLVVEIPEVWTVDPTTIVAGQSITTPAWGVFNRGTAPSQPFRVGIYLSSDPVIDAGDHQLFALNALALNPGEARGSVARAFSIPSSLAGGQYWVGIVADVLDQTPESNEANNVKSALLTVQAAIADLQIQEETLPVTPATVEAGQSITLPAWIVVNRGTIDAPTFRMGAYLSVDELLDPADLELEAFDATGLGLTDAVGMSAHSEFIPRATPAGSYWIIFAADVGGVVVESDETNNVRRSAITVTAAPEIGLDREALTFHLVLGDELPAPATIAITNSGGGDLGILTWSVNGPSGESIPWLVGLLSSSTAPSTLTLELHRNAGAMAPGSYAAIVQITALGAGISRLIPVTYVIQPALSHTTSVELQAHLGNGSGHSPSIDGMFGYPVGQLSVATSYAQGQPGGWLSASLSSTSTPAVLQLEATSAGLAVGEYDATVLISSPEAGNSPSSMTVRFRVLPPLPVIAVDPAIFNLHVPAGTAAPTVKIVQVTNTGGGTLDGLAVASINYASSSGTTGWLTASLDHATAPATLTLTLDTEALPPGGYGASVSLSSPRTPRATSVSVVVNIDRMIALDPPAVSFQATSGGAPPAAATVAVTSVAGGTVHSLNATISYPSDLVGWLQTSWGADVTPATLTVQADATGLPVGTHHATVRVSGGAANAPTIAVTLTVTPALADLAVAGIGGPLTVTPTSAPQGSLVTLSPFQVSNTGAIATGTYDLGIYISADEQLTSADVRIDGAAMSSLAPGASQDFAALQFPVPLQLAPGSYYIGVLLDGPAAVTEISEANNAVQAALSVTLAPVPPVAPANLTVTVVSGSRLDLSWTDNSANETGFRIEVCSGGLLGCADLPANPANFVLLANVGANVTTYSHVGLTAGTTYNYRVRAFNAAGSSPYIAASGVPTVATPTNVIASAVSVSEIAVTWTDVATEETGYQVWRCATAGCTNFVQIATLAANSTAFQDGGLSEATTYRYQIRAVSASHASSFSAPATATTRSATAVPAAPSGLVATVISGNQIDLAWIDNATNETGYRIERCTGAACSAFTEIAATLAGTTFQNTGLTGSTTYRYRVRAYNSVGSSAFTPFVTATTLPVPPVPTGLTATAVSSGQINLAWTNNSTLETGFRIETCDGVGCSDFTLRTTTGANITSYAHTALSQLTTYRYRLQAINANGASDYTPIVEAATPALEPPTGLAATVNSSGRITLTWTNHAPNWATSEVEIQRCTGVACTNFGQIARVDGDIATYVNTGLAASTTYRYRVRATRATVGSAYSAIVSATTAAEPVAPTALAATAPTSSSVLLTWVDNAVAGTSLQIERCSGEACTNFALFVTVSSAAAAYTNSGLQSASTYRYRVRTTDGDHQSAYSNIVTVTTQQAAGTPAPPTALTADAVSSTQINLFWTDNATNETGYQVERCAGATCTAFVAVINATVPNATTFQNTGLTPATTYRYRVRFFNAAGNSLYSNIATATTAP